MTNTINTKTSQLEQRIRTQLPVYANLLPPCNNACPVGSNIQAWLSLAQAGRLKEAWEKLIENNPMPAIHGRVCYHPCETSCNRKKFDTTVNIHAIERFLGDTAITEKWSMPIPANSNGKKILVVGAGPAGLSCSYHLCRLGYEITLCDALDRPGGMMYIGIPDYRLPATTLAAEAQRIIDMGINLKLNYRVKDILAEKKQGDFAAIFIAIGGHKGKTVTVPTNNPCLMWDSVKFLTAVKTNTLPNFGDDLVIYGGSNTAMDVARTARRLGIKNVHVVYHRTRQRMAAFQEEITEALEEGVNLKVLRQIQSVENKSVKLNVVELDATGSPQPTGQTETINCNMFVFAMGQTPDSDFLKTAQDIEFKSNGCIIINEQMMTGHPGVFAGGDAVPLDQSVTIANGHGKKAAYCIDAYLHDKIYTKPTKNKIAQYEQLNPWFTDRSATTKQNILDSNKRVKSFDEVISGINKDQAIYEAKRCLSCGNCFECDACYGVCPENAISKLGIGKGYKINEPLCTGCGACYQQCPCGAIDMEKS